MTKTPEVISRTAFMESLRKLGIDPSHAQSMTVDYYGVDVVNFVLNGKNKVLDMGKDGDLIPRTETVHIAFVD